MTNEEAIKRLKEQQNNFNEHWIAYGGINEAYNMAIQSIENEQKLKEAIQKIKDEIEHNNISDWIATQSVLDIIKKHTEEKK